jgi:hypothetical protein
MRYLSILFIFIVMFFVSSCVGGPATETNIGGIDMKFSLNQPASPIREDSNFLVGVELTNNIPQYLEGELCVYDTPANSFGGIQEPDCIFVSLSPAEVVNENKYPGTQFIQFPGSGGSYSYRNLAMGVSSTNINAKLKYALQSTTRAEICLKKDPSADILNCNANAILSKGDLISDFAPVGVDRIEYSVVPEGNQNRLYVDIHLNKALQGEVISEDNKNKLKLDIKLVGTSSSFDCYPSNIEGIEMVETTRVVKCDGIISMGEQEFYHDSLVVTLDYTYSTTISTGAIALKRKNEGI